MNYTKLVCGAETLFSRAKQFTEEKLGQSEKTEFDPNFVALLEKADKIKIWTEKIIKDTEGFLQPNQAARLEDFVSEKLQAHKPCRPYELETLAQTLQDASNDLGCSTPFGEVLTKCGEAEAKVAEAWKTFTLKAVSDFIVPMKNFLDTDISSVAKERKHLETKRLDLDVAKGKYKKVTAPGKEPDPNTLLKAEDELKAVQAGFDKQLEVTQKLLDAIVAFQADHVKHLNAFQAAQCEYFQACSEATKNIDK